MKLKCKVKYIDENDIIFREETIILDKEKDDYADNVLEEIYAIYKNPKDLYDEYTVDEVIQAELWARGLEDKRTERYDYELNVIEEI